MFTGISDPYEVPQKADIEINTSGVTVEQASEQVYRYLVGQGYLGTT